MGYNLDLNDEGELLDVYLNSTLGAQNKKMVSNIPGVSQSIKIIKFCVDGSCGKKYPKWSRKVETSDIYQNDLRWTLNF